MDFLFIWGEIVKGITETSKYILSHHTPDKYYKCYILKIGGRSVPFCSRCLGIYSGIFAGFAIHFTTNIDINLYFIALLVLPIPTLIDWSINAFNRHKSYNILRTFFGILLGIAYSFGLIICYLDFPNLMVIAIGIFYALIAGILIYLKNNRNA